MNGGTGLSAVSGASASLLDTEAAQLLARTRKGGAAALGVAGKAAEDAKIDKSAKDFESILMGSWLQQAEQSFATVPGGGEDEEDQDPGKDQFQGIAMQALAGSMTQSGGIGIAKMIAEHLHKTTVQAAEAGGKAN